MKVKIYKPSKNAMQSGRGKINHWVIESDDIVHCDAEPLMGWSSADSTTQQIKLKFPDLDKAVKYAQGQGWEYMVLGAHQRRVKPRNYVDNFKYKPAEH